MTGVAVLALGLIGAVLTLMLFPFMSRDRYLDARPVTFVAGVLFMPLFVAIAVSLQAGWTRQVTAVVLAALMAGFWASAAWLVRTPLAGRYVSGLTFGPGLQFRPDLILPGGVMFVKGIILSGVGMMIAFQDGFRLPTWNWWGFVLAFFGIITLIPARGMAKMLFRRARFLGRPVPFQGLVRWVLLVIGMAVLLYGFLAAFMGRTPIVEFRPRRGMLPAAAVLAVVALASWGLREWWKSSLPEGRHTAVGRALSNLWLYLSALVFMYGAVLTFMGRWMVPHLERNPWGVALGGGLLLAGAALVVGLRSAALTGELTGTIRVMVGLLADLDPERRRHMMTARLTAMARYPTEVCAWHMRTMAEAIDDLPADPRRRLLDDRQDVLLTLPRNERRALMQAMDLLAVA